MRRGAERAYFKAVVLPLILIKFLIFNRLHRIQCTSNRTFIIFGAAPQLSNLIADTKPVSVPAFLKCLTIMLSRVGRWQCL